MKAAAASPQTRWTKEQDLAINTTGTGLLVSAAAGSGKTSVLAERCANLVCDPRHRCAVNQILAVTFTEAAAAEIKSRIGSALRERLAGDGTANDPHLRRQLALLEHASVSTLHAFCSRLIRQNFHRLEDGAVDPNFSVLDGDEAALLRHEIVRDLFADFYEEDTGEFGRFVTLYGQSGDESLMDLVIYLHELLASTEDPARWRQEAIDRVDEAINGPLGKSKLGRELLEIVRDEAADLGRELDGTLQQLRQLGRFDAYIRFLNPAAVALHEVLGAAQAGDYAAMRASAEISLGRLPIVKGENKDQAKALVDAFRESLKDSALQKFLVFSEQDHNEALGAIRPHLLTLLNLIDEFDKRYTARKRGARSVDFSDLERLAFRLLCDGWENGHPLPSDVARRCHRQFRHVLVDEFQDINPLQAAILNLVSTECLCRKSAGAISNLFRVGDVKQSIYRFRLADPRLFIELDTQLRDPKQSAGKVIDLQHNFRSRGPLLEAINAVFQRLMTRATGNIDYDDSHKLRPKLEYPPLQAGAFTGSPIRLHILRDESAAGEDDGQQEDTDPSDELDRTEQEAALMAREIRLLMGMDGGGRRRTVVQKKGTELIERPIEYRDIVILMRSLRFKADRVADILRRMGVPVHCDAGLGYFASVEVRDILSVLKLLDNQRQDIAMAAVLRSPIALLPDSEDAMARIAMAFRDQKPRPAFCEAVTRYSAEVDDELGARLKDFLATLKRWRTMARQRPLAEVLWRIYDESGYLAYCAGLQGGEQRVANLVELHRRAAQFGTFQRQGLYRFLRFLDSLETQQDAARPSVLSQADNVVRIMTVHASKGLEFPVVFLPDLGKEHNMQATYGDVLADRSGYIGLRVIDPPRGIKYPSLGHLLVKESVRREALAEEIRLLYVAMTRAREHLVLFGTAKAKRIETWQAAALPGGPLSPRTIFAARTALDWLAPLAFALEREGQPHLEGEAPALEGEAPAEPGRARDPRLVGRLALQDTPASTTHFEVRLESAADLTAELAAKSRGGLPEELLTYARLDPLSSPPAANPLADEIIARMSYDYPHRDLTAIPAAVAATAVAHADAPPPVPTTPTGESYVWNDPLRPPGFLLRDLKPSAADRGVATHAVLAHMDFTRACDAADLQAQADLMLTRRLITPVQASAVDLGTIEWFLTTDLGQLVRQHAKLLLRELPLYAAQTPAPLDAVTDPLDQQMIRGRLDLLLPLPAPAGSLLIDYKTDRIPPDAIEQRATWYAPQLRLYAAALEKAAKLQITTAALVFLHPRQIWKVSL